MRGVQALLQIAAVTGRQFFIDGSLFTKTPLPKEPGLDRLYPKVRLSCQCANCDNKALPGLGIRGV